jgi:hypothetical protein
MVEVEVEGGDEIGCQNCPLLLRSINYGFWIGAGTVLISQAVAAGVFALYLWIS